MAQRVLITGGSGFIGTNLVEALLDDGVEMLSTDHKPPHLAQHRRVFREVELLDADAVAAAVRDFRPRQIVHLGARTDLDRDTALDDYAANTTGTSNLLDAVSSVGGIERILITSSMLVCRLGHVPSHDEDYSPDTVYGESKVVTERIARERDIDTTWTLIRPVTIWGPWHVRLEQEFYRVLRKGYYIHPRGRPCRRTYGYVGNSVHQIRALLAASPDSIHRRTFYIGDPPIELLDYIDGFARRLTGKPVRSVPYPVLKAGAWVGDALTALGWKRAPLTSYRLNNMTADNVLDVGPILELAGPNPYSLAEGIERTAAWLEQRG